MPSYNRNKVLFGETFVAMLQKEHYVDVPVYGLSMFPFYLPGDTVRVEKANPGNLKKGNVIVFTNKRQLVAHRLLKYDAENGTVLAKGDGLISKDRLLPEENVHGVVIHHFRNGKEKIFINRKGVKRIIANISPYMGRFTFYAGRVWNKFFSM
ncbi:signal peptidase I [Saccharicrinis carchari]|uniref:Signal peptidase I n=1 Tax=Saccharicrinis carchari TaxID=1168039 RepID=A0A521DNS8_SACCC|nr:hypothetical protein [Saccharicrinis carchari]SMO72731.1 signal peptidase I [Saccharicrinis carchari]